MELFLVLACFSWFIELLVHFDSTDIKWSDKMNSYQKLKLVSLKFGNFGTKNGKIKCEMLNDAEGWKL